MPKNPFDSAGVVRDEGAAEISFDSTGEPLSVSATVGFKSLLLCAATPCVTRLPPGGYAIHLGRQNYIGSTVLFQATRKPTIVTASCDEYTEYGNKHLTCTIAASHPADGKVYEGSLQ